MNQADLEREVERAKRHYEQTVKTGELMGRKDELLWLNEQIPNGPAYRLLRELVTARIDKLSREAGDFHAVLKEHSGG